MFGVRALRNGARGVGVEMIASETGGAATPARPTDDDAGLYTHGPCDAMSKRELNLVSGDMMLHRSWSS